MIRRATGVFRSNSPSTGISLQDITTQTGGNICSWSKGACTIDAVNLQPQPTERWTILGFAVTASLQLVAISATPFGRFGKIKCGLAVPLSPTPVVIDDGNPAGVPFTGLPPDASLITDLWNPDVDPIPPVFGNALLQTSQTTLPVAAAFTLPQPIDYGGLTQPTYQLTIGLWMLPSLYGLINSSLSTISLDLFNANYVVYYDDNIPASRSGQGIP